MDRLTEIGAFCLLIALAGCGTQKAAAAAGHADAPLVTVTAAPRGAISPTRQLGGFIAPSQNVSISTSLAEPASSVRVVEGDRVTKGEILATLDVTDLQATYEADLHAAREADAAATKQVYAGAQTIGTGHSDVSTAASTLAEANQKLRLDDLNLTRDEQLSKSGYIAQQTTDSQAQTVASDRSAVVADEAALRTAKLTEATNGSQSSGLQGASVASLREAAAQAHATADNVAAQIARATIYAPIDGVITNRNLNPGEYPDSRTLFTVQALSTVYAELNASSVQLASARVGNAVTVTAQGKTVTKTGRITAILGQAAPGSTNFTMKVRLDNESGAFLAGMAVTGRLVLDPVVGTMVPRTAFVGGQENAIGIVRDGKYRTAAVTVLAETTADAIVSGISPGTQIVPNGDALTDGQTVALR